MFVVVVREKPLQSRMHRVHGQQQPTARQRSQ
jgi:hypothetical protein